MRSHWMDCSTFANWKAVRNVEKTRETLNPYILYHFQTFANVNFCRENPDFLSNYNDCCILLYQDLNLFLSKVEYRKKEKTGRDIEDKMGEV